MNYKASVNLINKPGSLKGVASVSINDEFVVKGVRIFEGNDGPFVSMPSRKAGAKYEDICFPITKEGRENLHSAVLGAYEQKLTQQEEQNHEEGKETKKAGNKKSQKRSDGQKTAESNTELQADQNEQTEAVNYSQVSRHKKAHFFRGAGYFVCSKYKASASFGVSILSVPCGLFVL